nr:NUDIX hydrolase [Actinomycetota bacterium]
ELAEEVGKAAGRLELLARFYNSPGFSDELSWCYLARDLGDVAVDRQGVEEQHLRLEEVPLAEVPKLIATGQIIDAKTIIGLSLTITKLAG